jgi:N6-adenosine-specific RNA methylase IME4
MEITKIFENAEDEASYNAAYQSVYYPLAGEICINPKFRERIPTLQPDELQLLEASIAAQGCRDAIILWNLTIIDGHNRFEICKKNGINFKAVDKEFQNEDEALDFIDANQLSRRNLTDEQKRIIIGRRYNAIKNTQGGDRKSKGKDCTLINSAQILAEENNISKRTVKNYGRIAKQFEKLKAEKPELANDIFQGKTTFKEIQKLKQANKIYIKKDLPEGIFEVVYCDPPWALDNAYDNLKTERHYPIMTTADIMNLKLPTMADDALLLMWATAPMLVEALDVIKAWGFKYKTCCVWDKVRPSTGYWFRGQHELLLLATKGKFNTPLLKDVTSSVYKEKRTSHSTKPKYYYQWIANCFPNRTKIELFCREKYDDTWSVWGNEA